jgi:3-oxoacyl-[acyl-carrier protein] reductase
MEAFKDKIVLITGAGKGAGREVALAFSSVGASVAANDINPINLDETVDQILWAGGKAGSFVFDIAKRMPIEGLLAQVLAHFGRIDYLVNHASVAPDASLLEMDEWDFHRTLDVNLGGPFFTMQQVGRLMQQQGGGAMVNLIAAAKNDHFKKGYAALSASQAGLVGLTKAAARELAVQNIRVNTVCDGELDLGLSSPEAWDTSMLHRWMDGMPALKQCHCSELVNTVLFLCSNEALSLTGQVVSLSSG